MVDAERYFDKQAVPEFRAFIAAENALTKAVLENSPDELENARDEVMRVAWNASAKVHQMADYVIAQKPAWLPPSVTSANDLRLWLQTNHCKMLRHGPVEDVFLLADVADAFKHADCTQPRRFPRRVTSEAATITAGVGYGRMRFGEGKYGGMEQVIVTLKDGDERALSSILQNVVDAWRTAMGRPLPPFSE